MHMEFVMGVGVCFHKIKIIFLFSINSLTQKGLEFVPFSRNSAFSEPHPSYWLTPLLRLYTPERKCFKEALSEHWAPSALATGSPSRWSFLFCIFVMICEPNKTWVMSVLFGTLCLGSSTVVERSYISVKLSWLKMGHIMSDKWGQTNIYMTFTLC